nr:MAG TPA: hypothetical protein [Bacteriophage sp.]
MSEFSGLRGGVSGNHITPTRAGPVPSVCLYTILKQFIQ